jgi:hypothetical protein
LVIDGKTNAVVKTVPMDSLNDIAVNPTTDMLYVTHPKLSEIYH